MHQGKQSTDDNNSTNEDGPEKGLKNPKHQQKPSITKPATVAKPAVKNISFYLYFSHRNL
jgi:hypothetical protein